MTSTLPSIPRTQDLHAGDVGAKAPLRERLLSLDVFRGMTVAGMLLVNNPGSWASIYPPLEHAEWNGWTPTDLICPFFLFLAGITTHLSLSARRARGDDERAIRNCRQPGKSVGAGQHDAAHARQIEMTVAGNGHVGIFSVEIGDKIA